MEQLDLTIERGRIFTPDKKKLLIDELQREIGLLDNAIKSRGAEKKLGDIRAELQTNLNLLFDKKGVVTPQETDNILDLVSSSKRARLQTDFYMGMRKSTFYLLAFLAIGVGVYIYNKKRAK